MQEKKEEIKRVTQILVDKELNRVTHEVLMKNYERRFSCKQKEIFATIIGVDRSAQECSKLKRELKVKFYLTIYP